MIKTIMILATEDGRNRSAFNPPPQGNETLAAWQHGSVGHRLFGEESIDCGSRFLLSLRVTGG